MRTPIISVIVPVGERDLVSPSMAAALLDAGYPAVDVVFAVRNGRANQRLADAPEGTRVVGYDNSIQEVVDDLLGEWICVIPTGGHVGHGFFDHMIAAAGERDGSAAVTMHLTPGARIQSFPKGEDLELDDVAEADLPVAVMFRKNVAPRFVGGPTESVVWAIGALAKLGVTPVATAARMMLVGERGLVHPSDLAKIELSVAELALDQATGDDAVDGVTMRFLQAYAAKKARPHVDQRAHWLTQLSRSFPGMTTAAA